MSYRPKHFRIEELVSPELYEVVHEDALWQIFDPNLLKALDWLRERYGIIIVNDWVYGGGRRYSGLRGKHSPYYSPTSMHSVGKAADCIPKYINPHEVREDFRKMIAAGEEIPYITRVEDDVDWLHIDTKPIAPSQRPIHFFKP